MTRIVFASETRLLNWGCDLKVALSLLRDLNFSYELDYMIWNLETRLMNAFILSTLKHCGWPQLAWLFGPQQNNRARLEPNRKEQTRAGPKKCSKMKILDL